jgi:ABC-type hemin transport system substrate-binding protein
VLEARPATGASAGPHPAEESVGALRETVDAFAATLAATTTRWRNELAGLRAEGGRAVVWGASSKAVGFLTTLGVGPEVEVAVDINPFKQDMFVAGTGHRVVAPEELVAVRPDLVVAMNPIYVDEIREQLAGLGLSPRVVGV